MRLKRLVFFGWGEIDFKKKASNENFTSAASPHSRDSRLIQKVEKKHLKLKTFEISSSKSLMAMVIMMKHEIR